MNRGGLLLCFGGNGNLNVGTCFEPYLSAIFVNQRTLNTEVSIAGPFSQQSVPFAVGSDVESG
jgi:hypothetical protein